MFINENQAFLCTGTSMIFFCHCSLQGTTLIGTFYHIYHIIPDYKPLKHNLSPNIAYPYHSALNFLHRGHGQTESAENDLQEF